MSTIKIYKINFDISEILEKILQAYLEPSRTSTVELFGQNS